MELCTKQTQPYTQNRDNLLTILSYEKNVSDWSLLILRIGFAGMMLTHGIPKIKYAF